MILFHTSPTHVVKAETGVFGQFLCFSLAPYSMSPGPVVTYSLDIDDDKLIDSKSLFYTVDSDESAAVSRFAAEFDISKDDAAALIEQSADPFDMFDDSEIAENAGWASQKYAGEVALEGGFIGAITSDEQGSCYMIPAAYSIESWSIHE